MLRSREVKQKVAAGSSPLGRTRVPTPQANQKPTNDSRKSGKRAEDFGGARRRLRCGASCGEKSDQFASASLFLFLLAVSSQQTGHERASGGSCIIAHVQVELWRQHHVRVNSIFISLVVGRAGEHDVDASNYGSLQRCIAIDFGLLIRHTQPRACTSSIVRSGILCGWIRWPRGRHGSSLEPREGWDMSS